MHLEIHAGCGGGFLFLERICCELSFSAARFNGPETRLLEHLGRLAAQRGCGRFEWSVLDWNENAIRFYERMGASVMPEWRICRVTGDALRRLGG